MDKKDYEKDMKNKNKILIGMEISLLLRDFRNCKYSFKTMLKRASRSVWIRKIIKN